MKTCTPCTATNCGCHLRTCALGLSIGILWGLFVLVMGIIAHFTLYGQTFVSSFGNIYVGYGPSIMGSVLGGIIAFIHGFIQGFLIAWLYNFFPCCCSHCAPAVDKKIN